ncbi:MAG: YdeI/OmpD-associated family protein [Bacteroidota bacterium]
MEQLFFTGPEEFMGWLENHHDKAGELWVCLYKKVKGQAKGLDYVSAVEIALCYGWIDGRTQSIDRYSYKVRFTPRKPDSVWSLINIKRVEELTAAGLMHPAGTAAFARRKPDKTGIYSFEREHALLTEEMEDEFRENKKAWKYFTGSPPGYRKTSIYWIMSAKQEVTRDKRFKVLIECSSAGVRIPLLRNDSGHKKP